MSERLAPPESPRRAAPTFDAFCTVDGPSASTRPLVTACPVCGSSRLHYLFSVEDHRIVRCHDCSLLMSNPQPSDEELGRIYGADYFLVENDAEGQRHVDELKQGTADHYLNLLERYGVPPGARLLEIGCGRGEFLARASRIGMEVTGVEYSAHACETARRKLGGSGEIICGEITDLPEDAEESYDVCVLSDVIEHVRDPRRFLERVHRLLKPEGVVFIATPTLDSWSARLMKHRWMEFKPEHLWYFKASNLETLLVRTGFGGVVRRSCVKTLSPDYIAGHFQRYPVRGVSTAVGFVHRLLPGALRRKPVNVVASGMVMMARKRAIPSRPKLSVIVPVFNEAATFDTAFRRLLAKEIEGLDLEIIVVESHSTDGTREAVARCENHPRVNVIWQDRPRGKGHAVRAGLERATGDYVLIQDADLEYDLEDYDALLEPLLHGRAAFVLGARHGGNTLKIRHFNDQPVQCFLLNAAHWFFAWLLNGSLGLRMKDPFTMYKVFRRDCLSGLTFECNRFDFDWELVIKLARKGYEPLEIPVNYRSRSFSEGKKVSFIRDPLTWLRALVRCRFCKLDTLGETARQHRAKGADLRDGIRAAPTGR
jgi:SAM-dependent methyltransferase